LRIGKLEWPPETAGSGEVVRRALRYVAGKLQPIESAFD
jgi:hypothetical protein